MNKPTILNTKSILPNVRNENIGYMPMKLDNKNTKKGRKMLPMETMVQRRGHSLVAIKISEMY